MNATPLEKVLSAIGDFKRSGKSYKARCPAHDDSKPSLSISAADDGTVLLKCHSGCTADAIVLALGLTMRDLFQSVDADKTPQNSTKLEVSSAVNGKSKTFPSAAEAVADLELRFGKRSAIWTYHDAAGQPVGVIIRWDANEGKVIRPVAKVQTGWAQIGMPTPRPLYRLPELLQSSGPVYVVEGEKAADALAALGFTVTTSAHGAKSAKGTDWTPLTGRDVAILPDNDDAGAQYAECVVNLLSRQAPRPTVKIVQLSGLLTGGDIVDFIAARGKGATMDDAAIHAEIQKLTDEASAEPIGVDEPDAPDYQAFPLELLPERVRAYVKASAEAIGCDPAFIALPLLAALASAVGNSRRIALKRRWTEPAILWVLVVAASGGHKSPGFDSAMMPIRKRQEKAKRCFNEAFSRYTQEVDDYKQKLRDWRDAGSGDEKPQEPGSPVWERCWTDDTTVEALASLLAQNPRGLILPCDELSAWFASFDRYAKGGKVGADAARWLHIHGGRALVIDRKTGTPRTIFVPRATVSVAGGIQPGVLRRALSREHQESGMAARFLFAMPPKQQKRWTEAEIDEMVEADLLAVFDRLFDLQLGMDEDGEAIPRLVKLSTTAKRDHWVPYVNELGQEQIGLDDDLSATWSKLEGYAARLALVHHLVRVASNDCTVDNPDIIDEISMAAGIGLSRWFGQEAKRVFRLLGEDDNDRAERELVELINRLGGTVTGRELQRRSRKYKTAKDAELALNRLVEHEKGTWQSKPASVRGGRPTSVFVLRGVDTTPAKPKENEGSVNVSTEEQADDWGEA